MKLPKHAASIALIAGALGLGAYVTLVDKDHVSDGERASRPKNVFPAFRKDDLSRIEIATDKERLVFERGAADDAGDRDWRLTSPRDEKVEPDAVERLLGALEFATFVRKVDDAQGGQPPRAKGSLTMGKLRLDFALGQPAPSPEGASYFSVAGEGTWVIGRELPTELLKGSEAYRSRSIVPYLSVDLSRLEITSPAESWAIERKDDVAFVFADSRLRASRERLDRVWMAFADMRADSFVDSADDAHPAFTVKMVHKDASRPVAELAVLGPCPTSPDDVVVVRRAPSRVAACVPKVVLEGLGVSRSTLLDDRLFSVRADEAEEVTLESVPPGSKVELARKGGGWHVRAPFDRDLSGDEVDVTNGLVSSLARGVGTSVAVEPGCPPVARVTMVRTETHVAETLVVGACADKRVSVVRALDGGRLFVSAELARKLLPRASALEGREVFAKAIDPRDVVGMHLRCGVDQDLSHPGPSWSLDSPKGYPPDQAGAVDALDALVHARADAWVADADEPLFGLGASTCKATLDVRADGATRKVELTLGAEGEGGVYGRAHDERSGAVTPIFVVSRGLRDALSRVLVDRSALGVDPTRADSVRLEADGKSLSLAHAGGSLALADGGVLPGSAEIDRALGSLRADRVMHLGPPLADEGLASPSLVIEARAQADGGARAVRLTFGRVVLRDNQTLVLARVAGLDVTFGVAQERVAPLLAALR